MTIFHGHLVQSLLVIAVMSVAGTIVRNRITRESLTWIQLAVTAVSCAFVALFLRMLAEAAGLGYWYWAEIIAPLLYTAIGSPRFLLGDTSRGTHG